MVFGHTLFRLCQLIEWQSYQKVANGLLVSGCGFFTQQTSNNSHIFFIGVLNLPSNANSFLAFLVNIMMLGTFIFWLSSWVWCKGLLPVNQLMEMGQTRKHLKTLVVSRDQLQAIYANSNPWINNLKDFLGISSWEVRTFFTWPSIALHAFKSISIISNWNESQK